MAIQRILFQQREMTTVEVSQLAKLRKRVQEGAESISQILETYPIEIQDEILRQVRNERALRALACAERLEREAEAWVTSARRVQHKSEPVPVPTGSGKQRILRRREVVHRTGLSVSTIYKKMTEGTFPAVIRPAKHTVGWRESDIEAWIESPESYGCRAPEAANG